MKRTKIKCKEKECQSRLYEHKEHYYCFRCRKRTKKPNDDSDSVIFLCTLIIGGSKD